MTKIVRFDPLQGPAQLQPMVDALHQGKLVAFPTETVYGLGADAGNVEAVRRLFAAKGRPADNPLIVHLADPAQLPSVAREIPAKAEVLIDAFAPGPLTLILKKQAAIPDEVTAGLDTVAVRFPDQRGAAALLQAAAIPVVAPSANRSGRPSPTQAEHVLEDLAGRVDWILDDGPCEIGVESTVLDLTVDPPMILRPGAVTAEAILQRTGLVVAAQPADAADTPDASFTPRAPGLKYRHYAPQAAVHLIEGPDVATRAAALRQTMQQFADQPLGLFVSSATQEQAGVSPRTPGLIILNYAATPDAAAASQQLYSAFRDFDAAGVAAILAEALPESGLGIAYMNRLRKAAAPTRTILFVCTGNTCRSPMAAALFNDRQLLPGWQAESAGLAALEGAPASPEAVAVMAEQGIDLSQHRARQLTIEQLEAASLLIALTPQHAAIIRETLPQAADKVLTLGEWVGLPKLTISDPFGRSLSYYRQTARDIQAAFDHFKG